jgi:hypothetical protein
MGAAHAADVRDRHRRLGRLGPRRPGARRAETARLRRNCHRLVWLNPLAGTPGYQPLAGGMRAAFPYIDDFLPPGRSPRSSGWARSSAASGPATRRGSEAAAHAALPGATVPTVLALPSIVGGETIDPSAPRPLR